LWVCCLAPRLSRQEIDPDYVPLSESDSTFGGRMTNKSDEQAGVPETMEAPGVELEITVAEPNVLAHGGVKRSVQLTAHLYERKEVEMAFRTAALQGKMDEGLYWLMELCESGWVKEAWDQLWLAYYDFYAAHNPHFEGELMELMNSELSQRKFPDLKASIPLLHGASALIGRQRSPGAWLLRQGVLTQAGGQGTLGSGQGTSGSGQGTLEKRVDAEALVDRLLLGPVEAAKGLATLLNSAGPNPNPDHLWSVFQPPYEELVSRAEGELNGACNAWGRAGESPLPIMCALLLMLHLEEQKWVTTGGDSMLDLSPIIPDREQVKSVLALARRARKSDPTDRLIWWRQLPIPSCIGCFSLPRSQLNEELIDVLQEGKWLELTAGCPAWERAIQRCGGLRGGRGKVVFGGDGHARFERCWKPDLDEIPHKTLALGAPEIPVGKKIRWLWKHCWTVRPKPDLWCQLLAE